MRWCRGAWDINSLFRGSGNILQGKAIAEIRSYRSFIDACWCDVGIILILVWLVELRHHLFDVSAVAASVIIEY